MPCALKWNSKGVKGFDTFELLTANRVLGIDKIEIWELPDRLVAEHALNADIVTAPNGQAAVQTSDGTQHALPYTVESADGGSFVIQAVTERNAIVRFPSNHPASRRRPDAAKNQIPRARAALQHLVPRSSRTLVAGWQYPAHLRRQRRLFRGRRPAHRLWNHRVEPRHHQGRPVRLLCHRPERIYPQWRQRQRHRKPLATTSSR